MPHSRAYRLQCAYCGRQFIAVRSDAETCSAACRARRHRERRARQAVAAAALLARQADLARIAASIRDRERDHLLDELASLADEADRVATNLHAVAA